VRSSESLGNNRVRYCLRAVPVHPDGENQPGPEVSCELDAALVLDKLRLGQAVPTPEATFEQLWQQLHIELDLGYD
jgi:hypothetical protein